jgi:polysaccharide biosynthesis transport protein
MLNPEKITKRGARVSAEAGRESEPVFSRYAFSVLWYRRNMIFAAVGVTLLVAALYLIFAPARYTAKTTMVLETKQSPVVQNQVVVEPGVDTDAVETQVETIKSENVAAAVIRKLKLTEDPEFRVEGIISALHEWFSTGAADTTDTTADSNDKTMRTAIGNFQKELLVTRIPHSYAVEIAYTSLDPKKATTIANAIAEAYIEEQRQAQFELTKRARVWLQEGIAELRSKATEAFESVQNFKSQNNLLMGSDNKLAWDVELAQLTELLAKARAATTLARSRLAEIEAVVSTRSSDDGLPDPTVADALSSAVITKLRQQYLEDEKYATEYASRYGSSHQTVIKLRSEMANLNRQIRAEIERIAETYKTDLKVAQSDEQAIEKRISGVFQNNSGNRQAQVKLRELETAANTYRSVYEDFLNRYTQAVQQQLFPSIAARVITFASIGKRSAPKILLTLALAIIGGASLGAAGVFIREQMRRAIYSRNQVIRELGVSCIAALPVSERSKRALRSTSSLTAPNQPPIDTRKWTLLGQRNKDLPALLVNNEDPFSSTSEALRNIKVAMDLRHIAHETRTLGIVSALANEGKSSIALSLAARMAKAGRNVLLVDCDFRKPSLTNLLGLKNRAGILELLAGEAELADVTNRQYGFDFLCGPTKIRPVDTDDILTSGRMAKLLGVMKEHYDSVIVDLPPILPMIDIRACAHLFDSFALVAEWGKTSIDDLDMAFRVAPLVHERLLGIVLNKVDVAVIQRIEGSGYAAYGRYV